MGILCTRWYHVGWVLVTTAVAVGVSGRALEEEQGGCLHLFVCPLLISIQAAFDVCGGAHVITPAAFIGTADIPSRPNSLQ